MRMDIRTRFSPLFARSFGKLFSRSVILLLMLAPLEALAWGNLGHKVTAELAYRRLAPEARAKVDKLLGDLDFNEASLWADKVKYVKSWNHTRGYHYVDISDNMTYFTNLASLSRDEQKQGDAIMALLKAEEILRDRRASQANRRDALRFVLHILSDLHQPLHAGRPEDEGGNKIKLNWYGKTVKLHGLWDVNLIETAHEGELAGKTEPEQVAWYADYLEKKFSRKEDQCKADHLAWLNTSLKLREIAYSDYEGSNDAYLEAKTPTAERQLMAAGQHIACALNLALLDPLQPPSESELRIEIGKVLKLPLADIIALEPRENSPNNGQDEFDATHDDCH